MQKNTKVQKKYTEVYKSMQKHANENYTKIHKSMQTIYESTQKIYKND